MKSINYMFAILIFVFALNYTDIFSQESPGDVTSPENTANESNDSKKTSDNSGTALSDAQINEFLEVHNNYRSEVKSDPLVWSSELADYARAWAEHLANTGCNMEHRPAGGEWAQQYGENIYWSSGFSPSPKEVVDSWGSEKKDYDGKEMNDENFKAGHYTQMIWSQTTQVGCAIVQCSDGAYIAVCNYNPPGNFIGQSPLNK